MKTKLYLARAMSGINKLTLVDAAWEDKYFFELKGFAVLDPVSREGVKPSPGKLHSSKKKMDIYWPIDKALIRESHVFVNMSPHLPSIGVIREHGYARYYLQKPCVSVFPKGKLPKTGSICYYEDDFVTDNIHEAAAFIEATWGCLEDRLAWRIQKQLPTVAKRFLARLKEYK